MATLTKAPTLGDLLKYELNGNYTRETITLKSGTHYALGSVLGKITASGKYRLSPAAQVVGDEHDGLAVGRPKSQQQVAHGGLRRHRGRHAESRESHDM